MGGFSGRLGQYGLPVIIHRKVARRKGYKESIFKLLAYDVKIYYVQMSVQL